MNMHHRQLEGVLVLVVYSPGITGGDNGSSPRESGDIPWRREAPLSSWLALVSNGVGPCPSAISLSVQGELASPSSKQCSSLWQGWLTGHMSPTKSGREDVAPACWLRRFVSYSSPAAAASSAPALNPERFERSLREV